MQAICIHHYGTRIRSNVQHLPSRTRLSLYSLTTPLVHACAGELGEESTHSGLEDIPAEVFLHSLAITLPVADIVVMRRVSKSLRIVMSDDDLWMDMLTVLTLQHPVVSDLDKGADESSMQWYARCYIAIWKGQDLARQHKMGENPYLKLYGNIDGFSFTPWAVLQLPIERGFVAELVTFMKVSGRFRDAPKDAALLFSEAPDNLDQSFRRIVAAVEKLTRLACPPSNPTYGLVDLMEMLSDKYVPAALKVRAGVGATLNPRRAMDTLQRRLGHTTEAWKVAEGNIKSLNTEILKLRQIIVEKDKVIEAKNKIIKELKVLVVELKSKNHSLQGELEESKRAVKDLEHRPTAEQLQAVSEKLANERKARRAAERRIELMMKERTKLRRMLTCAEKGYDEAQVELEAAQVAADAAVTKEACAGVKVAQVERDAAVQVALAQSEAAEWMEQALDAAVAAEVEKRKLRSEQETLENVREEAASGDFSDAVLRATGIVMARLTDGKSSASLRPDNQSGKGRATIYRREVQSIKKSNLLSATQLWFRSKRLMDEINRVGGGGVASRVQTTHLINAHEKFFSEALAESRLAPATPLSLDQWAELGTNVSSCMGEQIRTFFRTTCGVKFPSKSQIKEHYAHSHFAFTTFPYEAVDLVETKVAQPDGTTITKVTKKWTNGVCGAICSLEDVLVRVVKHHQAQGNIAYPANIPADFVPFQVCLDAGAGTTKVILKLNIIKSSDSVKNLVLLAILSKAKDTYAAMAVAFKSIFDDFNNINTQGLWLKIGWRPALPLDHTIELVGLALEPRLRK